MKIKDHGREFKVLIVPKTIQKYLLYESHNGLDHNGTTRLYQFLKRQYYWKGLKESAQNLSGFVHNVKQQILQTPNYVQLYLEIYQTPTDFITVNWPI